MRSGWICAGITACLVSASPFAFGQTPSETAPQASAAPQAKAPHSSTPQPAASPATGATPSLTKSDVDGWLDGLMPYALSSGDVPGAVVVVVKDGKILTERGYGYADVKAKKKIDPETTMFRPGSVSKTFTWTAVMQLVQSGKIDLDRDINSYLDFTIPRAFGRPITMRNLMTHTPGFAEAVKHGFVSGPAGRLSLEAYLKAWTPKRIFPPGEVPAYSNWGATLAGYIVQRVSGEPFDAYIQHHIFTPLGMFRSTFDQPLPAALAPFMAKGYAQASMAPHPFELINVGPAGSLSTTGADMSRFMIAHLEHGRYGTAQILDPATEQMMQAPQPKLNPPLDGMALGFYHEDRNGHVVIGHAGDTELFHSDLHLLVNDDVGLFISMNARGREGAAGPIRSAFFHDFMDRYYPATPAPSPPTLAAARTDAAKMVGQYWSSRRVSSTFLTVLNLLGQAKVTAAPDGTIEVSDFKDASQAVKRWREISPFVWRDEAGASRLAAVLRDGKVVNFASDDEPPVLVMQPTPFWANASWNLPAIQLSLVVLGACLALWPIQALVRRRYGQSFALAGRQATLYRAARIVAAADLLGLALYVGIFSALQKSATAADSGLDPWLRLAQLFCLVGVVGVVVTAWNAVAVWRRPGRSWWARTSSILLFLASLDFAWIVLSLHLITPTLNY